MLLLTSGQFAYRCQPGLIILQSPAILQSDWLPKYSNVRILYMNFLFLLTECDAGSELINRTCSPCKMNYYKAEAGNHMCQKCPTNSEGVLPSGSTTCRKYTYSFCSSFHCQLLYICFSMATWFYDFIS